VTERRGRQPGPTQHVVDADHRCNFSQVPHLLLDDVASGQLHPAAVVLYLHYKRVAWEQHGQSIDETLRETNRRTGLGNATILRAREELQEFGWLAVETQGERRWQRATITLTERWEDNCKRQSLYGQKRTIEHDAYGRKPASYGRKPANGGRKPAIDHLKNARIKTEDFKDPMGAMMNDEPEARDVPFPTMALLDVSTAGQNNTGAVSAEDLLAGFYRGLGVDVSQLTANVYRREVAIARDLAAVGATRAEAEAYALETNAPGRRATVDMSAFEKGRASWLARRRKAEPTPPLQVANGRIPA
jgi:hypothetical protein